jgi:hypothetical protein
MMVVALAAVAGAAHGDEVRTRDFVIRYNALSADGLPAASAKAQGLAHTPEQGLLNVSVSRIDNDRSVAAAVDGSIKTLTGQPVPLQIRPLVENGEVTYLGTFTVPGSSSLHFALDVTPMGGSKEHIEFNQDFITE